MVIYSWKIKCILEKFKIPTRLYYHNDFLLDCKLIIYELKCN